MKVNDQNAVGDESADGKALMDKRQSGSVAGIDSIRFVAALWVALGHGARFPVDLLLEKHSGKLVSLSIEISNLIFCGIMAVIIFFIISGFCIHYPNVDKTGFQARRFLIRRIVRIGIPLAGIILVSEALGKSYVTAEEAVLWTIYCEIVYYGMYPLLLALFKVVSIKSVIIASSILTGMLLLWRPRALYLWQMGMWTWLYCLPFWLAGALAVEKFRRSQVSVAQSIWMWRIPPLFYGLLAGGLISHSKIIIGFVWTIPPFAIYGYFWMLREIEYLGRRPSKILEALGVCSYSIYLVHPIVICYCQSNLHLGPIINWMILLVLISIGTAMFYFLLEKPSHDLARFLGKRS